MGRRVTRPPLEGRARGASRFGTTRDQGDAVDLLKGTLDAMALKALCWGPMHGYGVTRWIRQRTDGALDVEDAALYQALHRMERRGWVASEWGVSENNRRAKYYRLTPVGRRQLADEIRSIRRYTDAMWKVLSAKTA